MDVETRVALLDNRVIFFLAEAVLEQLWDDDRNADGCCPRCCGPCWAIKTLLDEGTLDDLIRPSDAATFKPTPDDDEEWIWDYRNDQVNRKFLERAWRLEDCHSEV